MLTFQSIKKSLLFLPLCCIAFIGFGSCGDHEVDSKQVAVELNKPKSDATKERDERFLVQAAENNFEEVMLSKLANQRATDEEVKAMAKMLDDAHRKANSEITALAISKSIAVPTAATNKVMEDYEKLNLVPLKEFDHEYCSMVMQSHKEAISNFENYTSGQCDEDIKVWALGLLPYMRIRLDRAMEMEALTSNAVSELITAGRRARG